MKMQNELSNKYDLKSGNLSSKKLLENSSPPKKPTAFKGVSESEFDSAQKKLPNLEN